MRGRHRRGGEVVQKLAPHVAELNCIWATSWIFKTTFIIPTNDFPPIKQASREWHLNDIWVLSIYNLQFASNINIWGLFFFAHGHAAWSNTKLCQRFHWSLRQLCTSSIAPKDTTERQLRSREHWMWGLCLNKALFSPEQIPSRQPKLYNPLPKSLFIKLDDSLAR